MGMVSPLTHFSEASELTKFVEKCVMENRPH